MRTKRLMTGSVPYKGSCQEINTNAGYPSHSVFIIVPTGLLRTGAKDCPALDEFCLLPSPQSVTAKR
jgi:hypothetical protein